MHALMLTPQAVSGRVDKAFREHAPSFEILADNEHIWMVHPDIVGDLKPSVVDGRQEEESGAAAAQRRRGRRLL